MWLILGFLIVVEYPNHRPLLTNVIKPIHWTSRPGGIAPHSRRLFPHLTSAGGVDWRNTIVWLLHRDLSQILTKSTLITKPLSNNLGHGFFFGGGGGLHCSWISRWPAGRASIFFFFFFLDIFCCFYLLQEGVLLLGYYIKFFQFFHYIVCGGFKFSYFCFKYRAVIFSFLSSMRAGLSSSICSCMFPFHCHMLCGCHL